MLSLLVANPKCPSAFWGAEEKAALCPLLSPGDPSTAFPLCPHPCSPSLLWSNRTAFIPWDLHPQQTPRGYLGTCLHLWACRGVLGGSWHLLACWEGGPLGFFGISKHVEGKLLGSWHLQHVGGGILRHVGGVEELTAPPDVLW